ncbi:hypothetical protein ACFO5R_21570 [Halosolutus amylolyticus]|uniref:C2H2-type domain-containing protein n=1 Tax=Halosolutus amylolyticus TaxID=2932267 RepID=A0ABD5PVQ5_9EURY|nr:hypothetical protein [Halosolutus amylolyticus]
MGDPETAPTASSPVPTTDPGSEPAERCPYCGQPFRDRRLRRLHCGRTHPDRLADRERAAFERAVREERTAMRRFRLQVLGGIVLLYFGFLLTYAIVA